MRSLAANKADMFSWKHNRAEAIERALRLASAVREQVYVVLEGTEPTEYATAYESELDEGFHAGSRIIAVCNPDGSIE